MMPTEALADAALAEVLPPPAPPLPSREPEAMPSPESKPTSDLATDHAPELTVCDAERHIENPTIS